MTKEQFMEVYNKYQRMTSKKRAWLKSDGHHEGFFDNLLRLWRNNEHRMKTGTQTVKVISKVKKSLLELNNAIIMTDSRPSLDIYDEAVLNLNAINAFIEPIMGNFPIVLGNRLAELFDFIADLNTELKPEQLQKANEILPSAITVDANHHVDGHIKSFGHQKSQG